MNINKIREDFEILNAKRPPIYLDNSCMTLRPRQVIDAITEYYREYPACALRSHHKLSKLATEKVELARRQIQKFIGAKKTNEIIFTKNTTEGINIIANSFELKQGDTVISTDKEHNSNLIPWQILSKKINIRRKIIASNYDNTFNLERFESAMDKTVRLVSVVHTSNMDGVSTPIKEIIKIAHDFEAKVLVDAAQSMPHKDIDAKKLDADFVAFSGHKMLGPSGTGVLYGKESELEKLNPFIVGGETVIDSTYDSNEIEHLPYRFEAGLQNYAGMLGLGAACKYIDKIGKKNISKHEINLNRRLTEGTSDIEGMHILGPKDASLRGGIFSFNLKGRDPHDISLLADSMRDIALRSGAHCVHSWFNEHNMKGSVRASMYLYNTTEEIDALTDTLKNIANLK